MTPCSSAFASRSDSIPGTSVALSMAPIGIPRRSSGMVLLLGMGSGWLSSSIFGGPLTPSLQALTKLRSLLSNSSGFFPKLIKTRSSASFLRGVDKPVCLRSQFLMRSRTRSAQPLCSVRFCAIKDSKSSVKDFQSRCSNARMMLFKAALLCGCVRPMVCKLATNSFSMPVLASIGVSAISW